MLPEAINAPSDRSQRFCVSGIRFDFLHLGDQCPHSFPLYKNFHVDSRVSPEAINAPSDQRFVFLGFVSISFAWAINARIRFPSTKTSTYIHACGPRRSMPPPIDVRDLCFWAPLLVTFSGRSMPKCEQRIGCLSDFSPMQYACPHILGSQDHSRTHTHRSMWRSSWEGSPRCPRCPRCPRYPRCPWRPDDAPHGSLEGPRKVSRVPLS